MLLNIAGWLPTPATGLTEDDEIDVNFYDQVETSAEETQPIQPHDLRTNRIWISDEDGGAAHQQGCSSQDLIAHT